MKEVKGLLGQSTEEDEISNLCPSLSWSQRMWGFGICFAIGCTLEVLSCFMLGSLVTDPAKFAVLYTAGTVTGLCSTMFLMGPMRQLKKMFAKTRMIATIVLLTCIVGTLVCAFVAKNEILVIICITCEFLALFWYSLSYIPFGRKMVKTCCKNLISV